MPLGCGYQDERKMSNGNEHRKTLISCKVIRQNPNHRLKSTEISSFVITYLDRLFLYYVKRYSIPYVINSIDTVLNMFVCTECTTL